MSRLDVNDMGQCCSSFEMKGYNCISLHDDEVSFLALVLLQRGPVLSLLCVDGVQDVQTPPSKGRDLSRTPSEVLFASLPEAALEVLKFLISQPGYRCEARGMCHPSFGESLAVPLAHFTRSLMRCEHRALGLLVLSRSRDLNQYFTNKKLTKSTCATEGTGTSLTAGAVAVCRGWIQ